MTDPAAGLALRHDGPAVHVEHAGRPLLTYVHAPDDPQVESPRPYLHPVRTLAGDVVTVVRPDDHVWHKGVAWSLPHVGPHNFWGGPTYVRDEGYRQLDNDGSMDHVRFTDLSVEHGPGPARARVAHDLVWRAQPGPGEARGEEVVHEARTLAVTVPSDGGAWVLTFASTMRNVSGGPLDLGSPTTHGRQNAGYGGLLWRGPHSFTGGTVLGRGVAGGDDLRGTHAEWLGFVGRHPEAARSSTVVVVDDRANPHHPPQWFVRSEEFACLNPAPFFSAEVPFPPGASLTFRHALVVAVGGSDPARAEELADLGRRALAADA